MSDNTLTGCWRLEQVGQHSSDEDDLFSSIESRRDRGGRRVPSLCFSQYASARRLSHYQKAVAELHVRCRLRACLQLCWIAAHKASPDELYSPLKSAAAQIQQEVCRLIICSKGGHK